MLSANRAMFAVFERQNATKRVMPTLELVLRKNLLSFKCIY